MDLCAMRTDTVTVDTCLSYASCMLSSVDAPQGSVGRQGGAISGT